MLLRIAATAVAFFLAIASTADAQVRVRGYTRRDGTYVAPHYRSNPDGNFWNNWSTKGNVNPYTGAPGTRVTPPLRYGYGSASRFGAPEAWRSVVPRAAGRLSPTTADYIRAGSWGVRPELMTAYRQNRTYSPLGIRNSVPLSLRKSGWIGRWSKAPGR
jgi:hypothetical protein